MIALNANIYLQLGLKMNEHQLRRLIIDLVRWSEVKSEAVEELPFNYRKIVVAKIYCLMAGHLKTFFTPFYGYVYESFSKDLAAIKQDEDHMAKNSIKKDMKRQR